MEGNEKAIFYLFPIRYLLFGISDASLLLKLPLITTESWLKAMYSLVTVVLSATHFQLSQQIFLSLSYIRRKWGWNENNDNDYDKKDNYCLSWQYDDSCDMNSIEGQQNWWCINNVESTMQINHWANFYHVCHCLKTLLLHFSGSGVEIRLEGIMLQIFIIILFRISSKIVSLCSLFCSKSTDYSQYSQLYRRIFTIFFTFAIKNFENVL